MAKLIYVTNVSVDGYIEDEHGVFAWLPMVDELFALYTDLLRPVGTFLYGRRLYEAMAVWETDADLAARSDLMADFASVWRAASKVVYSTTSADSETACYTCVTALSDNDRQPCAVRRAWMTRGALTTGAAVPLLWLARAIWVGFPVGKPGSIRPTRRCRSSGGGVAAAGERTSSQPVT